MIQKAKKKWLPDGIFEIVVKSIAKVTFVEVVEEKTFVLASIEVVEEKTFVLASIECVVVPCKKIKTFVPKNLCY